MSETRMHCGCWTSGGITHLCAKHAAPPPPASERVRELAEHITYKIQRMLSEKYTNSLKIVNGIIAQELESALSKPPVGAAGLLDMANAIPHAQNCSSRDGLEIPPLQCDCPKGPLLRALSERGAPELKVAQAALERDRTKVAECVTAVKNELQSYSWLIEGRGSYEWDDDRWHDEFRRAKDAIVEAIEPMVRIAADWSNCPKTDAEVQAARSATPPTPERGAPGIVLTGPAEAYKDIQPIAPPDPASERVRELAAEVVADFAHFENGIEWVTNPGPEQLRKRITQTIESALSERGAPTDIKMADAAEMLWVVLANVSGGDWSKQSQEWQDAAARWRNNYFEALNAATPPTPDPVNERGEPGIVLTGPAEAYKDIQPIGPPDPASGKEGERK